MALMWGFSIFFQQLRCEIRALIWQDLSMPLLAKTFSRPSATCTVSHDRRDTAFGYRVAYYRLPVSMVILANGAPITGNETRSARTVLLGAAFWHSPHD